MNRSVFTVLSLVVLVCFHSKVWALTEVRLALHWFPQAQFAGYYVALEKGFYTDAGIRLTILPGGPDTVPADRLSSGEVQFATMFLSSAIERRLAGISLVNIAQIVQRSALMIVTKEKTGITTIADLEGSQVTMWGNEFQLQAWALFKQKGVNVSVVPSSGSMELFLKDAVPATLAMWYNGYHTILSSGYREKELQSFFFKDTDFDFPEDGMYCLSSTVKDTPDLVNAFIEATLKGWEYTRSHEEESLDIVASAMEKVKIPFSKGHQRWMLDKMKDIMQPKDAKTAIGTLSSSSFKTVVDTLVDAGFNDTRLSFEEFFWSTEHVR